MSTTSQEAGGRATGQALPPAVPRRISAVISRRFLEPVAVAFTSATLLFLRLMFPTPVGVADNYDGSRLLCHLSLYSTGGSDEMRMWVNFTYVIKQKSLWNCSKTPYGNTTIDLPQPAYNSSQLILMNIGRYLTQLLGLKNPIGYTALDLRVLGAVACVFIGAALGLLFAVLRSRRRFRYLLIAALLAVIADASFIDFAASPLSEISAVIGLLFLLPAMVLLFRGGRARWAGAILALGAGMFLISSKAQMIVLVVPMVVLLVAFPLPVRRLSGRIGSRVIPVGLALVLAGSSVALTPKQDPHFTLQTKADFVFNELLYVSPNPKADMKALGIPDYYSTQVGHTAWCPPYQLSLQDTGVFSPSTAGDKYVARAKAADPALDKALNTGNWVKFLLLHPDRAVRVANDAANSFFYTRPTYTGSCWIKHSKQAIPLGNYDSGHSVNAVDKRFTPVTSTLRLFSHAGLIPLLLLWLLPAAVVIRLLARRRDRASGERKTFAWMTLFLSSVGLLQFGVAAYGDGIDTSKHMNLSIFASVLAVVTAVATARLRPAPAGAAVPAAVPDQSRRTESDVENAAKDLSVLVIIPTYNEAENLDKIVTRVHAANADVHVLVADDNSPDGTGKLADGLAEKDERVKVLHRAGKEGLGKAYLAGFAWGIEHDYDVICEMDADGSHRPEDFPALLAALVEQNADLVLGSRYVPGGKTVGWPKRREILSKGGNAWVRLVTGMKLADATGGYRLFRRETLEKIELDSVVSAGYTFQVDLAWRAVRAGLKVVEVPITFVERELGASKMSGAIVAEALWRTAFWGTSYRLGRLVGKK
nr:polyprenol monophosphomannose synthase [Catenulispora rubra]